MNYPEERRILCEICQLTYQRGLVFASDGNFSLRLPDGGVLITPSGRNKGMIAPEDLIAAHMDGTPLDGQGRVSKEFPMHRRIYELRPDTMAILHSHPIYATAFASASRPLPEDYFVEAPLFLGQVPVAPYATPGTPEMADAIEPFIARTKNILLKNHGAVVYDVSPEAAFNRLETLETVCRTAAVTDLLGGADRLSPAQLALLLGR